MNGLLEPIDTETKSSRIDNICGQPHTWYAVLEGETEFTLAKAQVDHPANELLYRTSSIERILQIQSISAQENGLHRVIIRDIDELKMQAECANIESSIYPDYVINDCFEVFANNTHSYKAGRTFEAIKLEAIGLIGVTAQTYGPNCLEEIERQLRGSETMQIEKKFR